jgi:hypothetical protein
LPQKPACRGGTSLPTPPPTPLFVCCRALLPLANQLNALERQLCAALSPGGSCEGNASALLAVLHQAIAGGYIAQLWDCDAVLLGSEAAAAAAAQAASGVAAAAQASLPLRLGMGTALPLRIALRAASLLSDLLEERLQQLAQLQAGPDESVRVETLDVQMCLAVQLPGLLRLLGAALTPPAANQQGPARKGHYRALLGRTTWRQEELLRAASDGLHAAGRTLKYCSGALGDGCGLLCAGRLPSSQQCHCALLPGRAG